MNERQQRLNNTITDIEQREKGLGKIRKPSPWQKIELCEARADLAHGRQAAAELLVQELTSEVEQAELELVKVRADGGDERPVLAKLEATEARLNDRDVALDAAVRERQYEAARTEWQRVRADHRADLAADIEQRGEQILAEVARARELMAAAETKWSQLDHDAYILVRNDYDTAGGGTGEIPTFPGFDGGLHPARPRDPAPAPVRAPV